MSMPTKVRLDDPDFEPKVLRMVENLDSKVEIEDEYYSGEDEPDQPLDSDHETESEESASIEDEEAADTKTAEDLSREKNYYYGKNRFKWAKQEPRRNITSLSHNIIKLRGLRQCAKEIDKADPLTTWSLVLMKK